MGQAFARGEEEDIRHDLALEQGRENINGAARLGQIVMELGKA